MIVGGVHILIGIGNRYFAIAAQIGNAIEASLTIALPTPPTHDWGGKVEREAITEAVQTDYSDPLATERHESYVGLPGQAYLGATAGPFGTPVGFGPSGLGAIGFALAILTSPGMQDVLYGEPERPLYD